MIVEFECPNDKLHSDVDYVDFDMEHVPRKGDTVELFNREYEVGVVRWKPEVARNKVLVILYWTED